MSKKKQKQGNKEEELKNTPAAETKKEEPQAPEAEKAEETKPATDQADKPAEKKPEADKRIAPYFKAYPKCDVFFRTSDGQVFLQEDLAKNHQRTLKKGKLETIKKH